MVNMYRCTTTVTGVAGSPYYMTGYFLESAGTAEAASDAWFAFCTAGGSTFKPLGSTWRKDSEVPIINSTNDSLVGSVPVTPEDLVGSNTDAILPPATQLLVRWRTASFIAGRRITGRTFYPLRFESENTPLGVPDQTTINGIGGNAQDLIDDEASSFGIYSRKNGTFVSATTASVATAWSVLRSRRTE